MALCPDGTGSPRLLGQWLSASVLFGVTLLAYVPAMQCGFIWDDDTFLTQNPLMRSASGLLWFWCTTQAPDYFPLTSSMLWLEWRLWGMDAAGYHVMNAALHGSSCVLLWRLLLCLQVRGAWVAALVFGLHPVNVESVAWITERKNTLSMLLCLASVLCYLRFVKQGRPAGYWLALILFVLSLLSKTSAVLMPVVLLALIWRQRGRVAWPDLRRTIPFFVVSAILSGVTMYFHYHKLSQHDIVRDDDFWSRLATAGMAVWFYLSKAVWPTQLCFLYPRWAIGAVSWWSFVPTGLLLALWTLLWLRRRAWGDGAWVAMVCYVAMLFPVLGFFNVYFMRYSLVADHWQYSAIPAVIALLVALGTQVVEHLPKWQRPVSVGVTAVVVSVLFGLTWKQQAMYRNETVLWGHTLAMNPRADLAHNNLGLSLQARGRTALAARHFRQALLVRPDQVEAHSNLATNYLIEGQISQALGEYREAIRLQPHNPVHYFNMGCALAQARRVNEALSQLQRAVELDPDYAAARYNLGSALVLQGRKAEAMEQYKLAVRLEPELWQAHVGVAKLMVEQGQLSEAMGHASLAVKISGGNPQAYAVLNEAREQGEQTQTGTVPASAGH